MNSIWSSDRAKGLNKRRKHLMLLLCVFMITVLLGLTWKTFHPSVFAVVNTDLSEGGSDEEHAIPEPDHIFTWAISAGDTLTAIFENYEISQNVMYQILSADESLLALDVLSPGNLLTFTLDQKTHKLVSMELFIHPGKRVIYNRVDDTSFNYDEIIISGEWKQELLNGEIIKSFYLSARSASLTDHETGNITDLFRDHIQFARDIRAGDRFQVIRSRQFVDGEFTGQSRIEGVRIFSGKRIYSAFLFDDGNYYDHKGKSLARALRRYPMAGHYRIISHFNPARRHPITHRITQHNGVDFTMPTGTPILSTGDGVVTRVHNHPFAGKYIEIQHGSQYATRYMHLSQILVKRGQTVQRGARIALSGNTGRSTGPHLHFELHVRGRPVNPLTAKIPMASAVPDGKLAEFNQRVGDLVSMMEQPWRKVALHRTDDHF
ncbi:MAG: peptidoglycan DD-metalloendopeptidase family protein [Deltaproteobacteria bacterium]|nr:peptidoglycan DD-metalloendopeptidase family protein [Deltaproteobacteria bacterium]